MANREKVIEELEWILAYDRFGFGVNWETGEPRDDYEKAGKIITDTIALLKEQEPVAPQKHYNNKADLLYTCGKCRNDLKPNNRNAKFCWFCGRAVKWK